MNNIEQAEGEIANYLLDELMSVKLLFNRKEIPAQTCKLNKCLLTLRRQKCSSSFANNRVCVWN